MKVFSAVIACETCGYNQRIGIQLAALPENKTFPVRLRYTCGKCGAALEYVFESFALLEEAEKELTEIANRN